MATRKRMQGAAKAADDLFVSAPAQKETNFPEAPDMGRGFDRIIEKVFDMEADEVESEFDAINEALKIKEALTPGALAAAANRSEDIARRAYRLLVVAQYDHRQYEWETDILISSLRAAASASLEEEKRQKIRTKNITDADVKEKIAAQFPEQWNEVNNRRSKASGMVTYIEKLASLAKSRAYTVSNMLNPVGRMS